MVPVSLSNWEHVCCFLWLLYSPVVGSALPSVELVAAFLDVFSVFYLAFLFGTKLFVGLERFASERNWRDDVKNDLALVFP